MINKPKLSVIVTSIDNPTIYKEFNKSNGLTSLSIDGVTDTSPHYGIISHSGSISIIDVDGWLKEQSDANIFPDIEMSCYVDNVLLNSFQGENEISFTIQDKKVSIDLQDSITLLQNETIINDILIQSTDAYSLALYLFSIMKLDNVVIDKRTSNYLKQIIIDEIVIQSNTKWEIINNFAIGCRSIFYKLGNSYYLKILKE